MIRRRIESACRDYGTFINLFNSKTKRIVRRIEKIKKVFIVFVNCSNVKWAASVQSVFAATKIFALLIIIFTGLYVLLSGKSDNFKTPFENTNTDIGHIALSFYSGLYSYSGWNFLNFVTEELKDPYKVDTSTEEENFVSKYRHTTVHSVYHFQNLPRAIWISLPIIMCVYVFANVSYFTVLSPSEILLSEAVAVSFAQRTLGVMAWVMPLFVACSTFGGLNGAIFTGSRLCFVGARGKHFPEFLAMINLKRFTPMPALVFGGLMTCVYLCIGNVYKLMNYMAFVEGIFFGITVTGLIILRITRPNMKRPIKINIVFPVFYLCIVIFLTIMSLTSSPWECFVGIIVLCTGIPVYVVGIMWKRKPKPILNTLQKLTEMIQKISMCIPEQQEPHYE